MKVQTELGVKDVAITEVTPENYITPKGEEHLYHAVIEVKKFDANTGQRQSKPRVQKFGKKSFESGGVRTNLVKQGYDIVILHDPNKWLETNKAELEQRQAEANQKAIEAKAEKEAKAKADPEAAQQKKIDDAVKAALDAQAAATQKQIDAAVKAALDAQTKTAAKSEVKSTTEAKTK